ncbi:Mob1/phocein, partial [Meredithblackwellia eburnea MCA 4105]
QDAFPLQDPFQPAPSFSDFENSGFPVQEYLAALVVGDSSDCERICAIPVSAERVDGEEDEVPLVSSDCWVYEQLRRLSLDLTLWVVKLQKECNRETCPDMKAQSWLFICAAHAVESEVRCCAIDYIHHTLDGATALLSSQRYFPSRLNIPESSLKHFTAIARRLYRIFAHAYYHHRRIFDSCEAETSLYERFLALTANFDLVDAELLIIPLGA